MFHVKHLQELKCEVAKVMVSPCIYLFINDRIP
jgi:hypothetical protein